MQVRIFMALLVVAVALVAVQASGPEGVVRCEKKMIQFFKESCIFCCERIGMIHYQGGEPCLCKPDDREPIPSLDN